MCGLHGLRSEEALELQLSPPKLRGSGCKCFKGPDSIATLRATEEAGNPVFEAEAVVGVNEQTRLKLSTKAIPREYNSSAIRGG